MAWIETPLNLLRSKMILSNFVNLEIPDGTSTKLFCRRDKSVKFIKEYSGLQLEMQFSSKLSKVRSIVSEKKSVITYWLI